jgi:hypothetical protein
MPSGLAIKTAFTAKALPLAKDRQSHSLTACEGRVRPWVCLHRQRSLAKIVNDDVKSRQEGVRIGLDHRVGHSTTM